jgi:tetratricopeptide (TPR) repeat protein
MADPGGRKTDNTISGGIFFSAVVQGRDITVQLPPEITPALSGLPSGAPAFTGRDADLRILLEVLSPRATADGGDLQAPVAAPVSPVVVAAVGGLAGIGKTELAVQAARAALDRGWFPGGVLFVDLFGYDPDRSIDPGQALEGFLRALAIPAEHVPPHTQDRARLYTSVLAAYAREGRQILVVIDNAATHEQVKPLLPAESGTAAIVTSRHTLGLLGARLLDLETLAPGDAAEMLDRVLRISRLGDVRVTDHPADAARIVRLCGELPLALRIIAALLSEDPGRPLAEMANDLDDERTRLDELSYADAAVRAAFALSYQRLDAEQARLFRLLAINPGPEISTQAASALADVDQPAARRGLEALARAHLIEHGSSYGRWGMHDLLRLYARYLSDADADTDRREEARDRLLLYYQDSLDAANTHLRALPGAPVPAAFADRRSALAWLDAERLSLVAAPAMAASTGRDEIAMGLPLNLSEYLSWRRYFDDWLATTTISRDAARRLGDRRNEAGALGNLGIALRQVRRLNEAITAHQDAAAIYRETGDRRNEAAELSNLGVALVAVRRFDQAITAHQDAAAIFRETGDRHGEGKALDSLGSALQAVGQLEEAITAYHDAAAIFRETGDQHGEGMGLNNLGSVLAEVGRLEEAITACQDAALIFQETGDRHGEGMALNNLGHPLARLGRLEEAITACQDAALIFQETGDRHHEGKALNNLGSLLQALGRLEEAIAAHQDAAAIYRETGDRHGEGKALNNLGSALATAGRSEEAIIAHQDAAVIFREVGDRRREGIALSNLKLDRAKRRT